MSINTKIAKKLLTKAEQKHLTHEAGINSMAGMKRHIDKTKHLKFPCNECERIARKLGMLEPD